METITKGFLALITGLFIVFATVLITMFATRQYGCSNPTDVKLRVAPHSVEYLDRIHDPTRKVTAIRAIGAEKCYILTNDNSLSSEQRSLRIIKEPYQPEVLRTVAGNDIVTFCEGRQALPVEIVEDDVREKRQDNSNVDVQKLQQTADRLHENECQNDVIVDCGEGNSGVYKCKTGPASAYRAQTTCQSATTVTFSIVSRCKECAQTEKQRFIKCIQSFIFNTQGDCSEPAPTAS